MQDGGQARADVQGEIFEGGGVGVGLGDVVECDHGVKPSSETIGSHMRSRFNAFLKNL